MIDAVLLDYARSIDHSLARIADALEQIVKTIDERATERQPQDTLATLIG